MQIYFSVSRQVMALEYPVFTYNDVCYIPMTYDLCERLSLSVGFDKEKGLFITNLIH